MGGILDFFALLCVLVHFLHFCIFGIFEFLRSCSLVVFASSHMPEAIWLVGCFGCEVGEMDDWMFRCFFHAGLTGLSVPRGKVEGRERKQKMGHPY